MFREALEKAKLHAVECFPNESCGIIVNKEYVKCSNVSDQPTQHFIIDPKIHQKYRSSMQAVIHSHVNGNNFPSKDDMANQMKMSIPWGIICLDSKGMVFDDFWFGDQVPRTKLIGRPFRHGVHDCYALVRDWFLLEKGIVLPNYPRDNEWWKSGLQNILAEGFEDAGFFEVSKLEREGDVVIGMLRGKIPNHCAVYLGDYIILHHFSNSLSRREPVDRWLKYVSHILRHKEMAC